MFIALKPLKERKITAEQVVQRLRGKLAREPGASLFLNPVQDIRVGGRLSDATYQFTLQGDDLQSVQLWAPRLEAALRQRTDVATDVNSDQEVRGLQTSLVFDRESAARLGLGPKQIDSALNLAFGQAVVSTIYAELNQYRVVMEVAPQYWQSPEGLKGVWLVECAIVPARNGIPGPKSLEHGVLPLTVVSRLL
jgi:multidrug efflux pump